jgi:hypothetical protein
MGLTSFSVVPYFGTMYCKMDLGYFTRNPLTDVKRFPDSGTARMRPSLA